MSLNRTKRHASRRVFFYPSRYSRLQRFVAVVLVLAVYGNLGRLIITQPAALYAAPMVAAAYTSQPAASTAASTGTDAAAATSAAVAGGAQKTASTTAIQTPRACTGASFAQPTALAVTALPDGLTQIVDTPSYYQVYGSSLGSLRSALDDCPLRRAIGSYHAVTAYQLNWSYSTTVDSGTCKLTNIRVGAHIGQYLPSFVATARTPQSVAAAWQTYAASLKQHEDGHIAIDIDYAQRLLTALQSLRVTDCGNIGQQAQTITDSYVALLNGANELYDSRTNHGATQGAVL